MGDVVVPTGVQYQLPVPLLRSHDHAVPIGTVDTLTVTPQGIEVSCTVARGIAAADASWQEIQQGIMPALSIGFRGIASDPIKGGYRWRQWELLELSIVAVPANASARIQHVSTAKAFYTPDILARIGSWENQGREDATRALAPAPSETILAIAATRTAMIQGLAELDKRLAALEGRA